MCRRMVGCSAVMGAIELSSKRSMVFHMLYGESSTPYDFRRVVNVQLSLIIDGPRALVFLDLSCDGA